MGEYYKEREEYRIKPITNDSTYIGACEDFLKYVCFRVTNR